MCGNATTPTSHRCPRSLVRAWLAVASFFAAISFPGGAGGAFELSWPSARSAALAGAEVEFGTAPSASDPLGRSGAAVDRIELSAGELYGLPEARGFLARTTLGSRFGSATLSISQLGGELYRERTVGIALARPLREAITVEAGGRLLCVGARGVPERLAVALDAGFVSCLLGRIVVAARWRNIGDTRIGESPVSAGAALGAGLILERIRLSASLELERGLDAKVAVGCEAAVSEWLRIRAGVAAEPGVFGVGLGIGREPRGGRGAGHELRGGSGIGPARGGALLTWPVVDLAITWHPDLGGSSFATLSLCR